MEANTFAERPAAVGGAFAGSGRARFGQGSANALSMKWSALQDSAATVALLAGIEAQAMTHDVRAFPVSLRDAQPAIRELIEDGVADIPAIMELGLSTLIAAYARGASPQAAAAALWHEFLNTRDALMALVASRTLRRKCGPPS